MSNKFLLQASVFMFLSLASGWVYLNNISYKEPLAQGIPDSYNLDIKSPQAIKEAITKAEEEVKELDVKIDDLKTEMTELSKHKTFLRRFISSFSNLLDSNEHKSNSKGLGKTTVHFKNNTDSNESTAENHTNAMRDLPAEESDSVTSARRDGKSKLFSRLPSEVQDMVFDVEEQAGRSMVNLNRHENMLQAEFNGDVFIRQLKSGRYIVPEYIVDTFSEISSALGGIYKISNIVISSPKDSRQKERLVQFIESYLGEIKDQIDVQEKDTETDLQFSVYYKDNL